MVVVDKTCEEYHRQQGLVVRSTLSYVIHCSNQARRENANQDGDNDSQDEVIDTRKALI